MGVGNLFRQSNGKGLGSVRKASGGVYKPSTCGFHVLGAAERPRTRLGRELVLVHDQVRQVLRHSVLRTVCPGPADDAVAVVAPVMISAVVLVLVTSPLLGLFPQRAQQHVQAVLELVRGRGQLETSGSDGDDPEPQVLRRRRVAVQAVEHGPDVVVSQPL